MKLQAEKAIKASDISEYFEYLPEDEPNDIHEEKSSDLILTAGNFLKSP